MPKISKNYFFHRYCELLEKNKIKELSLTVFVQYCHCTRQAFYYYFSGINEMIKWGFDEIKVSAMAAIRSRDNPADAVREITDVIHENQIFLNRCMNSDFEDKTVNLIKGIVYETMSEYFNTEYRGTSKSPFSFLFMYSSVTYMLINFIVTGTEFPNEYFEYIRDIYEMHNRGHRHQ